MDVGVLSIGDEVLSGMTVNTNLAFLGRELSKRGDRIVLQITTPDDEKALFSSLDLLYQVADLVICTGGLGVTTDDITKGVLANYFDIPLVVDKECKKDLEARFSLQNFDFAKASMFLKGAEIIRNSGGYAHGFWVRAQKRELIALPGVPSQLEEMFKAEVEPKLQVGGVRRSMSYHFFGVSETDIDQELMGCEEEGVSYGLYSGIYTVTVVVYGNVSPSIEMKLKKFREHEFNEERLEKAVHKKMITRAKTLTIAESCTGGALAAKFTALADTSKYLVGSYVVYSDGAKEGMLGVSPETLEANTAVSREVIIELLDGLKQKHGADIQIAVSGVAGPSGGTQQNPVGTVYVGIDVDGLRDISKVPIKRIKPDRQYIIEYSCYYILGRLWQMLR